MSGGECLGAALGFVFGAAYAWEHAHFGYMVACVVSAIVCCIGAAVVGEVRRG